jgi:parallel beta-helix repeat protein
MAATTVNGKLLGPTAAFPTAGTVTITLVDYSDNPALGFNTVDQAEIISTVTVTPNSSGVWTASLVPNVSVQLASGSTATAYRITESGAGSTFVYWIVVTSVSPSWAGSLRTQSVAPALASSSGNSSVVGNLAVGGTISGNGSVGWFNVKAYGAKGDSNTDDTAAINAAITACPGGGVVYLPAGFYRTTSPIVLKSGVTLMGDHGNHLDSLNTSWNASRIKPRSTFVGAAAIYIPEGATTFGNIMATGEQRISCLTLDGSAISGSTTVDAIQTFGVVHGLYIDNVGTVGFRSAFNTETNGISGQINRAYSMRLSRIHAEATQKSAFVIWSATDSTFTDLEAEACGTASDPGFYIRGGNNSTYIGCRAEECFDGFYVIDGANNTFVGCSTHRSNRNGMHITSTTVTNNAQPINIVGCRFHGDGMSGNFSALYVDAVSEPVVVTGLITRPENTLLTPDYGVTVANSKSVVLSDSFLWGYLGGFNDGGGNAQLKVAGLSERSGSAASPTTITSSADLTTNHYHTSGMALGNPQPRSANGLIAWTCDPYSMPGSASTPTLGTLLMNAVFVDRTATASNISFFIGTAAVTPTSGQNFAMVIDSNGTVKGSVEITTAIGGTGLKTVTLSSTFTVTPGMYWLALLFNGTTGPQLLRTGVNNIAPLNLNRTSANLRCCTSGSALTAVPASITPGSNSTSNTLAYWIALG